MCPDVLAAILIGINGRYERAIVLEVLVATWGAAWWTRVTPGRDAPECEPCSLSLKTLASGLAVASQRLYEAKVELVRRRILILHPDGRLSFNKRYSQWLDFVGGPAAAAYCHGHAKAMTHSRNAQPRTAPSLREISQQSSQSSSQPSVSALIQNTPQTVVEPVRNSVPSEPESQRNSVAVDHDSQRNSVANGVQEQRNSVVHHPYHVRNSVANGVQEQRNSVANDNGIPLLSKGGLKGIKLTRVSRVVCSNSHATTFGASDGNTSGEATLVPTASESDTHPVADATLHARTNEPLKENSQTVQSSPPVQVAKNTVSVLIPTQGPPDDGRREPAWPGPLGVLDVAPGPHKLQDAEAKEIHSLIWKAWGSAALCRQFYEQHQFHAAATWKQAIQELFKQNAEVRGLKLVMLRCGSIEVRAPEVRGQTRGGSRSYGPPPVPLPPDVVISAETYARFRPGAQKNPPPPTAAELDPARQSAIARLLTLKRPQKGDL